MNSGDPCPFQGCAGYLSVRNSRPSKSGRWQYRYLVCPVCGEAPAENVERVPAERIRRRNKPPRKVLSYTPDQIEKRAGASMLQTVTSTNPT
jgi:hypothetical protein